MEINLINKSSNDEQICMYCQNLRFLCHFFQLLDKKNLPYWSQ